MNLGIIFLLFISHWSLSTRTTTDFTIAFLVEGLLKTRFLPRLLSWNLFERLLRFSDVTLILNVYTNWFKPNQSKPCNLVRWITWITVTSKSVGLPLDGKLKYEIFFIKLTLIVLSLFAHSAIPLCFCPRYKDYIPYI